MDFLENKDIRFHYVFEFDEGERKDFTVILDKKNLKMINTPKSTHTPHWSALQFSQCPHCTLDPKQVSHCPIAVNLARVIDQFQDKVSFTQVKTTVTTEERTYVKLGPLQKGLSSLMGIYMVTSGCPIMEKLQPMVRFHLPFATAYETLYRVISMYLTAQYFIGSHGGTSQWDLEHLKKTYEDVKVLNRAFSKRIVEAQKMDSGNNALVILDCFADDALFRIDNNLLEELESLFLSYIEGL